ncbi:MAG: PAS domain S-box protein [Acidobacteriales bacterium]|nr:MAG: PAS domain S-box protein [Terriglobales bacterium]
MAEALLESEQRFQATFDQTAVGLAHAGLDDCWLLVNQRFCEIVGHRREDLIERPARHLMYPEDLEMAQENMRRLLAGELQSYSMDMRWHRDLGPDVWIRQTRTLARAPDGDPKYFVAVIEDISLRKQAEEQRSLGTEELARSNAELEQFAYVVSHDLQEPLRMVASYVQLLEARYKDRLDSDAHDFIAYAVDGATRMKQMIGDLLAYSRVGRRGKEFVPVACEAVLDQACADLQTAITEAAAEVSHGPLPTVLGNAGQLAHLFQNLIGNAIKFRGQEPPRIHVSAERNEREWNFSVRDNGIGLDPQFADRIFLVFQRLHRHEDYPGTGIGLAIAKKIVEHHGGRIWVESEPGKGATFHFTIPATPPEGGA